MCVLVKVATSRSQDSFPTDLMKRSALKMQIFHELKAGKYFAIRFMRSMQPAMRLSVFARVGVMSLRASSLKRDVRESQKEE